MSHARFSGPVEAAAWPRQLVARVATPGPEPRLLGYDVERDLAPHYASSDVTFLLLTGELPPDGVARAFAVALAFLAPISVAHAATHAGVLARLSGAQPGVTVAACAAALAEQARHAVAEHAELLAWLEKPEAELPARYRSERADDAASVVRLAELLRRTELDLRFLGVRPTREAALFGLLHACGFRRSEQLEAVLVLARLPVAVSEAFAEKAANFASYPTDLPAYRYEDPT